MFDRKEPKTVSRPGALEYFNDLFALLVGSSAAVADPSHNERVCAKLAEWIDVFGLPWAQHEPNRCKADRRHDVVCVSGYARAGSDQTNRLNRVNTIPQTQATMVA